MHHVKQMQSNLRIVLSSVMSTHVSVYVLQFAQTKSDIVNLASYEKISHIKHHKQDWGQNNA